MNNAIITVSELNIKGEIRMNKVKLFLCLIMLFLLISTCEASVLSWYWGTDPNSDYTAFGDTSGVYLPFTMIANGENIAGSGGAILVYNGSNIGYDNFDLQSNGNGVQTGTITVPNRFAIRPFPGQGFLPIGSYTSIFGTGSLIYYAPGSMDPTHDPIFEAHPINNFVIQIQDGPVSPAVPEPASMLLLGMGSLAMAILKKKNKWKNK